MGVTPRVLLRRACDELFDFLGGETLDFGIDLHL
jgi:hypothetical protein